MILKKGSTGRAVKELQTLLKFHGFWGDNDITEYFGDITTKYVKEFQQSHGLTSDGIVGKGTLSYLLEGIDADYYTIDDAFYSVSNDTDNTLERHGEMTTQEGLVIDKVYLDSDEYIRDYGVVEIKSLFIHHTAGWHNPYSVINSWNKDTRGRVATEFVIGGSSIKGNTDYDGKVVQAFPSGYLGWHLGKIGNINMSLRSCGIELNNFGYLLEKDGKFYTYPAYSRKNGWRTDYHKYEVNDSEVCDLGYEFRGHRYWHNYSDDQIESLRKLIMHLCRVYDIEKISGIVKKLKDGISAKESFEFHSEPYNAEEDGIWTHTNVRKDKFDCYPHPKLVEMLINL